MAIQIAGMGKSRSMIRRSGFQLFRGHGISKRVLFLSISALALVVVVGCQESKSPESQSMAAPQRVVVASGGNGGGTAVFIPSSDPQNPAVYCSDGVTACPECKAAAVKYFTTGVLDPKCSRTGATRTWDTNVGHQ